MIYANTQSLDSRNGLEKSGGRVENLQDFARSWPGRGASSHHLRGSGGSRWPMLKKVLERPDIEPWYKLTRRLEMLHSDLEEKVSQGKSKPRAP